MRLSILLAVALTTLSGCTNETSTVSTTPPSTTASRPWWLVGNFHYRTYDDGLGDWHVRSIDLGADGSGTDTRATVTADPSFGGSRTRSIYSWSATDDTLVLDGARYALDTTPNCRLVSFGGSTYEVVSNYVCPLEMPALTEGESALVGVWKMEGASKVSLRVESDRSLKFDLGATATPVVAYWEVDASGVLHGTLPDGSEVITVRVQRASKSLSVCDDSGCIELHG
jgi:hypothetical protein